MSQALGGGTAADLFFSDTPEPQHSTNEVNRRLFAIDVECRGVRSPNGSECPGYARMTQRFTAAPINAAVACQLLGDPKPLQWPTRPTLHEVLPAGEPARFFVDCNVALPRGVADAAHEWGISLLGRAVHAWLAAVWPARDAGGNAVDPHAKALHIAECCEGARFSARIVTGTWLTDVPVQGRAAMASFASFLVDYIESHEHSQHATLVDAARANTPSGRRVELAASDLDVIFAALADAAKRLTLVDAGAYTANAQRRMLGSGVLMPGVGAVRTLYATQPVAELHRRGYFMLPRAEKATWRERSLTVDEVVAHMAIPGDLWTPSDAASDCRMSPSKDVRRRHMLYFSMSCRFIVVAERGAVESAAAESGAYEGEAWAMASTPARREGIQWERCPQNVTRANRLLSDRQVSHRFANAVAMSGPVPNATDVFQFACTVAPSVGAAVVAAEFAHNDGILAHCVDGDELLIAADGKQRRACRFREGELVFCPHCATSSRRQHIKWPQDGPLVRCRGFGQASATVCMTPMRGVWAVKCWNTAVCGRTTSIVNIDATGRAEADVVIDRATLPRGYLTLRDAAHPSGIPMPTGDSPRLVTIDAPLGSGKTQMVIEYVTRYYASAEQESRRVLFVTFRRALARKLAHDAGIDCYLDGGYSTQRCAICVNSLLEIPTTTEPYDLVVVDDAALVMYHLAGDTFKEDKAWAVLARLNRLLHTGRRVVLLQHDLSATVVDWYRLLCRVPRAESLHILVTGALRLPPALVLSAPRRAISKPEIMDRLNRYIAAVYLNHAVERQGVGLRHKIFIPVSTRYVAHCVYAALCAAADEHNRIISTAAPLQRERIRVICADPGTNWDSAHLDDVTSDVDVLIATPALQKGVCLSPEFTTLIAILPNDVLSHRDELQLVLRSHMANATDSSPWSLFYIEHSVTGAPAIQDWNPAPTRANGLSEPSLEEVLRTARTAHRAESSDSDCRHLQLWCREFEQSGVAWTDVGTRAWDYYPDVELLHRIADHLFVAPDAQGPTKEYAEILGVAERAAPSYETWRAADTNDRSRTPKEPGRSSNWRGRTSNGPGRSSAWRGRTSYGRGRAAGLRGRTSTSTQSRINWCVSKTNTSR